MAQPRDDRPTIRPYNLFAESHPARARMPAIRPTLERINDRLGRYLRSALLQHLRRALTVTPTAIDLVKHKDLIDRFVEPTYLALVNMKPLRGMVLVTMDTPFVATIVETRFGGDSRFPAARSKREFTALELRLMRRIEELIVEQIAVAWEPFVLFEPSIVRRETNPQFASFAAADDLVITSTFDVTVDHGAGQLTTCIPYVSLEPMHGQLMTRIVEDTVNYEMSWQDTLKSGVEEAQITLSAEFGNIDMVLSDILALRPGHVFTIERPDRIVVSAGGVPLFGGVWGKRQGKLAVRIEETLPAPADAAAAGNSYGDGSVP